MAVSVSLENRTQLFDYIINGLKQFVSLCDSRTVKYSALVCRVLLVSVHSGSVVSQDISPSGIPKNYLE